MRNWIVLATLLAVNSGCTTPSVRDHAVSQAISVADMRYQEVLDNLAVVAHNTGQLPSFAVTSSGIANVTNTISVDSSTAFANAPLLGNIVKGFSGETLNAFGSHNPELLWTVAPVAPEPNLEALKYACLWVLCGPPPEGSREMELLRAPKRDDIYACRPDKDSNHRVGYHFDVASQLEMIQPGWLGVGSHADVPPKACYKAHCCGTYVWVTADGLAGLSEFTLVVLDIATVDPLSLVLPRPTAKVEIRLKESKDPTTPSAKTDGCKSDAEETTQQKPDAVTEVWDICQEPNGSGMIRITRPKAIRPIASQVPDIVPSDFNVGPSQATQAFPP